MHLPITVVTALLCSFQTVNGYSNSKTFKTAGLGHSVRGKSSQVSQEKTTALSAILPTVYSAVAVASVIAFHEAGTDLVF